MKGNLREHRARLEELRQQGMTDYQARQAEQQIEVAEQWVRSLTLKHVDTTTSDLMERGSATLDTFTSVSDDLVAFVDEIASGRYGSVADARAKLGQLRAKHAAASAQRVQYDRRAERLAEIQDDPLRAGEEMLDKYPALWPDLDF